MCTGRSRTTAAEQNHANFWMHRADGKQFVSESLSEFFQKVVPKSTIFDLVDFGVFAKSAVRYS
jgi:hypothetical protein